MSFFKKMLACLLGMLLLFSFPCSAEESLEKIGVTVSIFDSTQYGYLMANTSLNCPEGISIEELCDILTDYSLIDGFSAADGQLLSLTTGETTLINSEAGYWAVEINGTEGNLLSILDNGDAVSITFYLTGQEESALRQETESLPAAEENSLPLQEHVSSSPSAFAWTAEYAQCLSDALSFLRRESGQPEAMIALGSAGVSAEHKAITDLIKTISNGWKSAKQLSLFILAAGNCSLHASNVNGQDLLTALLSYPDPSREDAAWCLLAMDSNGYPSKESDLNGRDACLNYLLAAIEEDGGLSPSKGQESSPYLTALFTVAASQYQSDETVRLAVGGALEYLSQKQKKYGGFEDENGFSLRTLCTVLIAVNACGLDTEDPRFVKNGVNMLDTLLKFQNSDGGFTSEIGKSSDLTSTFLAAMALLSAKNSSNPFLLRTKVTGTGSITVFSQEEKPLPTVQEEPPKTISPALWIFFAFALAAAGILGLLLWKMNKHSP